MTRQVIERGRLGVLSKIGQGGQGVVYRAPNAKTTFASSMVFKEYKAQALVGIDFTALAAMPALVEESLSYAEAERLVSMAAWPCAIVEDAGTPVGFVMPAIPQEFFISLTTVKGVSSSTAEFQHLLNDPTVLAARGITVDDVQRCTLLREVASGLAFLHKHGVCVGDISPKNVLFSLTPPEAMYFIDCDAVRINGVSALEQVETPGWEAPAGEDLATVYSDAYKLGLLALRLISGDQDTTNPAHLPSTTPGLLRQIITDTLSSAPHQRPLPEAWTYVLGNAIEEAQHQQLSSPAPAQAAPTPPPRPVVHSRPPVGHSGPPVSAPASAPASAPVGPPGPPMSAPSSSTSKIWAGVTLASVVIAALVAIIVTLANHTNRPSSSAPQTPDTQPTTNPANTATATPAYTTSQTYSVTVPPSPAASAGVPGLAPFAREWKGMRESISIDLTGQGQFHYMMICTSCSMADTPYGTMDFTLTSVSGDTASGSVTTTSDAQFSVGDPVTVTLAEQDTIRWAVGGQNIGSFCGSDPAFCGG